MIKAIRVRRSSMKTWNLHGPIDQALKTTIQCDAVRCIPLSVPNIGPLDLWIDADTPVLDFKNHTTRIDVFDNINILAFLIVLRELSNYDKDVSPTSEIGKVMVKIFQSNGASVFPIVSRRAVITGSGATDIPAFNADEFLYNLTGVHLEP